MKTSMSKYARVRFAGVFTGGEVYVVMAMDYPPNPYAATLHPVFQTPFAPPRINTLSPMFPNPYSPRERNPWASAVLQTTSWSAITRRLMVVLDPTAKSNAPATVCITALFDPTPRHQYQI